MPGKGFKKRGFNLIVAGHDEQGFVLEIPEFGAESVGIVMLLKIHPFLGGSDFL